MNPGGANAGGARGTRRTATAAVGGHARPDAQAHGRARGRRGVDGAGPSAPRDAWPGNAGDTGPGRARAGTAWRRLPDDHVAPASAWPTRTPPRTRSPCCPSAKDSALPTWRRWRQASRVAHDNADTRFIFGDHAYLGDTMSLPTSAGLLKLALQEVPSAQRRGDRHAWVRAHFSWDVLAPATPKCCWPAPPACDRRGARR